MLLNRGATDTDWFDFLVSDEERVRFCFRNVPTSKMQELRALHCGRVKTARHLKDGTVEIDSNPTSERALDAAVVAYAFVDAENAEWAAVTSEEAERLAKILGRPVAVGDPIALKAGLPREALEVIFWEDDRLRVFAFGSIRELAARVGGQVKALGKALPTGSSSD
jgi:hypothetical protein